MQESLTIALINANEGCREKHLLELDVLFALWSFRVNRCIISLLGQRPTGNLRIIERGLLQFLFLLLKFLDFLQL